VRIARYIDHALLRWWSAFTRIDVESCRTHVLPVAVAKAAPSAGERQAKRFRNPHSQGCTAAISQSTHNIILPWARGTVAQSSPRAPAVDTA
jgi:hypothetical protein